MIRLGDVSRRELTGSCRLLTIRALNRLMRALSIGAFAASKQLHDH